MKKILLTISGFLLTMLSIAQSPNLMNYQGVARNGIGNVLPLQPISLRLSILNGSASGPAVYVETRNVTTNAFGLFNVIVGGPGATSTTGTIAGINWTAFGAGSGNKFLQVEIDPAGGSSYFNVGVTQMVSVPYALNAGSAAPVGPAGGDLTGTYPNPQILFPLVKTFSFPTTQLIGMTNSATTGTLGAITGSSASTDGNATAIRGTISSSSPGGFSSGVSGINNGTGGNGVGVTGTQNGSGWGVYGFAPSGTGVYGNTTSGSGVIGNSTTGIGVGGWSNTGNAGNFFNSNAANTSAVVAVTSNGVGDGVNSTVTGTGRAGWFQVNNAASTANAIEASTNGTGASWGIRANSSGTNGAGLFVQSNATNTSNNVQSNQGGLGRAGLFQSTNSASNADALVGTSVTTGTSASAVRGTNGSSGVSVGAKKGVTGESDSGIGMFGSSSTGNGIFGVTNNGAAGVAGFAFGNGSGIYGQGGNGRAGDFLIPVATNTSTAVNVTTAGLGITGDFSNTNAANLRNTIRATNENATAGQTSATNGEGAAIFARKGAALPFFLTNPAGVYATSSDGSGIGLASLTSTNIANFGGTTSTGVGVLGQTFFTGGIGVWALGTSSPTSFGLVTAGRVQIQGQGAGVNRVLTSDNVGNATWETLAASGGVSGTGTLNYVPKWTPDGTTIGNSQLFDNGTNVGLGTVSPNGRLDINNTSTTARGLMVNNTAATNASSTIYAQTSNVSGSPTVESAAITAAMAPFGAGTTVSTLTTPVALKAFAAPVNTVGFAGGTAIQGSTSGGVGVMGLANDGTALYGFSLGGGYALQTSGRVQIIGQGAAAGRVLTSDAAGNASWQASGATPDIHITSNGGASQVLSSTSLTNINSWTGLNEAGGANYNPATGEYTIPVDGYYAVKVQIGFAPAPITVDDVVELAIRLNGSTFSSLFTQVVLTAGQNYKPGITAQTERRYVAGDIISFATDRTGGFFNFTA